MKRAFADTFYRTALLNPKDQWYLSVRKIQPELANVQIIKTETVLIELMNFYLEYGSEMRQNVVDKSAIFWLI